MCQIIPVSFIAIILPALVYVFLHESYYRLLGIIISSLISVAITIYFVGLGRAEQMLDHLVVYSLLFDAEGRAGISGGAGDDGHADTRGLGAYPQDARAASAKRRGRTVRSRPAASPG